VQCDTLVASLTANDGGDVPDDSGAVQAGGGRDEADAGTLSLTVIDVVRLPVVRAGGGRDETDAGSISLTISL